MRHLFYYLSNPWLFNKVFQKKMTEQVTTNGRNTVIRTQAEAERTEPSSKLWTSEKATSLCPVCWPSWIAEFKRKNTVGKWNLQIMFSRMTILQCYSYSKCLNAPVATVFLGITLSAIVSSSVSFFLLKAPWQVFHWFLWPEINHPHITFFSTFSSFFLFFCCILLKDVSITQIQ